MTLKEGQSITRPPLLEGSNYATWKPVMRSFLKSLDERAWKAVMSSAGFGSKTEPNRQKPNQTELSV
ncbi:unnamed protein product [Rhodiola kirilowii]